ncbi:MAG: GNAT family N-acetyltransferase [Terriglobia bacterium]
MPADLQTLCEIDDACFPPGVSYSQEELAGFIRRRNSQTWIAEEGKEVVGFLVASETRGARTHIVTIDVKQEWRRRGVGAALMDAAERWTRTRGLGVVTLETAEDNRPAQAFYRKRGYVKLDEVKNYYADGSTAWVMGKRLR